LLSCRQNFFFFFFFFFFFIYCVFLNTFFNIIFGTFTVRFEKTNFGHPGIGTIVIDNRTQKNDKIS